MWATGDTIRGQLHQETFYGAIKPAKRNDDGSLAKDENGRFIQDDKIQYVIRVPFQYKKDANTPGFKNLDEIEKHIVDEGLKIQIKKQVEAAGGLKEAFDRGIYLLDKNDKPHGNKIRHIRVWASVSEPLVIKKQTYFSKKEYKQYYLAANATNSYFAIYKCDDMKGFVFRNLFETAKFLSTNTVRSPRELFESTIVVTKGRKTNTLYLSNVLNSGIKVIFYRKEEGVKSLTNIELLRRLYVYTSFEKDGRLSFKYHLEARNKIDEKYSESEIDFENPKPTLRFGYAKYDFLVQGCDFDVEMDGVIKWRV
jgi:CRISPR-associated endonuclease Csn1